MAANPKYGKLFKSLCHRLFVKKQPCCACGMWGCEAHHPLQTTARQKKGKSHDYQCVPLCLMHHRELHDQIGGEWKFEIKYCVRFKEVWTRLCKISPSKKVRKLKKLDG